MTRKQSQNGNWKGGITYHKKGYALRRVANHPRASNGYVFEHVIVIEHELGRLLLDGETVHHKNGVKNDNRVENLELWCRPHPSGIRASDAIVWARQIMKLYGP